MTELDINALVAELDEEFVLEVPEDGTEPELELDDTLAPEDEETIEDEIIEEEDEEPIEEDEGSETEEEDEPIEDEPEVPQDDVHKRNEAFKKLREERDKLAKSDAFLTELASQYGLSKEQLIERFTAQQAAKKAEESGLTPEQYKKLTELEKKVVQIEEEKRREVFNIKAEAFSSKYKLSEKDMVSVFTEANKLGLDVIGRPDLLEVVYRTMNFDKAVELGRQKQLETSKTRRTTSVGRTGTTGGKPTTTELDWDKEIDAILSENHITKRK